MRASEVFGVDIHPAARIGKGIFLDHATGLVVGEDPEEDAKWFRVSENGITLITQDMLDRRAAG